MNGGERSQFKLFRHKICKNRQQKWNQDEKLSKKHLGCKKSTRSNGQSQLWQLTVNPKSQRKSQRRPKSTLAVNGLTRKSTFKKLMPKKVNGRSTRADVAKSQRSTVGQRELTWQNLALGLTCL
jgi:hypothetical protein